MGADFARMYQSGLDLWQGQYSGLYPLPMSGWFALLALLPEQAALALATFTSLALLVALFRRRALVWLFFQPILTGLFIGECDVLFMWLLWHSSPVALALMTLKPQLFPLAVPSLLADRSKWRPFMLACLALYGPVTFARPTWPIEWMRRVGGDWRLNWSGSTSILAAPLIGFGILLALAAIRRLDWRTVFWTCNPSLLWYDFGLLAGGSLWLVPLSWLLCGMALIVWCPAPVAFLGLADLALRRAGKQSLRWSPQRSPARGPWG